MKLRPRVLPRFVLLSLFCWNFANAQPASPPPGEIFITVNGCKLLISEQRRIAFPEMKFGWSGTCIAGYAEGRGVLTERSGSGELIRGVHGDMVHGRMNWLDMVGRNDKGQLYYGQRGATGAPTTAAALPQWARGIVIFEGRSDARQPTATPPPPPRPSGRGPLQFGSAAAFCQSIIDANSEMRQFEQQVKSETNPLKRDAAVDRFRAHYRAVDQALDNSFQGAQATNWNGKVTSFEFVRYSNGPAANVAILIPCSIPTYLIVRFWDWDGNPHTKGEDAPLSRWKPFLESLAVGDSVVFSVRLYFKDKGPDWFASQLRFSGAITDIRKSH